MESQTDHERGEPRARPAAERAARARLEAELAAARAELAAAEARHRAMFAGAADAILVADADRRYVDANPAASALLGYTREELLRLRVDDVVAAGEGWAAAAFAAFLGAGSWRGELDLRRKDGSVLAVDALATAEALPDGTRYVSAVRDIGERRRAEARLREETEALATVNRIGRLLSAELDLQKLVQAITDAATAVSGARLGAFFSHAVDERGEHFALSALAGAPPEAFAGFPMPRNTAVFGPVFRGEGPLRLADVRRDPRYGQNPPFNGLPPGHPPVASFLAVPVVSRSREVLGGLFVGHPAPDVFGERAERVVVGLAAQAAVAIDNARLYGEAQEAIRARDRFLSIAAHELRTPIAGIKGYAQMALRSHERGRLAPDRLGHALRTINRAAERLAVLTNDLLDVSRIRLGQLPLRPQPLDLATLVGEVVDRYRDHVPPRHRLVVEVEDGLGPVVADPDRVEQVLTNLLDNAVKYSPDGGPVAVGLRREGDGVLLRVRDAGIGLPPGAEGSIFEPFGRAANAAEGNLPGLGLGLSICRGIIERHGGRIRAESAGPGAGTTMSVWLPAAGGGAEDAPAGA